MQIESSSRPRLSRPRGACTQSHEAWTIEGLTVELHRGPRAVYGLKADWRDLERRVADCDLFGSFDWTTAWCQHGLAANRTITIVAVRDESRLLAVLPLAVSEWGLLRSAELVGAGSGQYGSLMADLGPEPRRSSILKALWSGIERARVDAIRFEAVREDSCLAALLDTRPATATGERLPSVEVSLASYASLDAYMKTRSSSLRQNLRRRSSKLGAEGKVAYRVIGCEHEIPAVIERMLAMKLQWLANKGLHGRFLAQPEIAPWLTDVALAALKSGRLHLSVLTVGNKIVAGQLGFLSQNRLTAYLGAFDDAYATYAVGKLHLVDHLADLAATGTVLDLMPPDDAYKLEWGTRGPAIRTSVTALTPAGHLLAWAMSPQVRATAKSLYLAVPKDARAQTASFVLGTLAQAKRLVGGMLCSTPIIHQAPVFVAFA